MSRRPFTILLNLLLMVCTGSVGLLVTFSATADTRALIAAGIGGSEDYELEFQRHANRAAKGLREVTDDVTILIGDTADRDAVKTALDAIAGRSSADDTLIFLYVGHGSYDEEHFKFNVPGKDFTAIELNDWLEAMPAEHQLIVVTGSSSGAIQLVLEKEGRTVMTGTRSGGQRNTTMFGAYFTAEFGEDAADVDKDQRITAVEAFRYAEAGVLQHYETEAEMSPENPLSKGPEPVMVLAHLTPATFEDLATVDTARSHLYTEREALELDIMALQDRKDSFSQEAYYAELQKLLLELAMVEQQLIAAEEDAAADEPGLSTSGETDRTAL